MKQEHIERAKNWYNSHTEHVKELIAPAVIGYKPSDEDIGHPEVWKPGHWRWFINSDMGVKDINRRIE